MNCSYLNETMKRVDETVCGDFKTIVFAIFIFHLTIGFTSMLSAKALAEIARLYGHKGPLIVPKLDKKVMKMMKK